MKKNIVFIIVLLASINVYAKPKITNVNHFFFEGNEYHYISVDLDNDNRPDICLKYRNKKFFDYDWIKYSKESIFGLESNNMFKVRYTQKHLFLNFYDNEYNKAEIKIYDLSGKLTKTISINSNSKEIVSYCDLNNGVYIVTVQTINNLFYTDKIFVNN